LSNAKRKAPIQTSLLILELLEELVKPERVQMATVDIVYCRFGKGASKGKD
jgi:hypothetical protein